MQGQISFRVEPRSSANSPDWRRRGGNFVKIMRTGIDLDQAHPQFGPLLQVMPWPTYQSMTDHDLRAIYEYLRSIPSATPGP